MIDPDDRYLSVGEILRELGKKNVDEKIWETDRSIIPGFRRNVAWHKAVAIIGYFYMAIAIVLGLGQEITNVENLKIVLGVIIFVMVGPFLIIVNFLRWDSRWEVSRKLPKYVRFLMRLFVAFVWMGLGTICMAFFLQGN